MNRHRMAMFGGLLAAAVTVMVTGVAARSSDAARAGAAQVQAEREPQDRRVRPDRQERIVVAPHDRRVIRLDGRGSRLGVMVSDAEDVARPGVRIDEVDEGSAAAKAGAKAGDVVVDFDGERVRSARQLTRLVQETPPGRAVKMTVLRDGSRVTLDVTPATAETEWNARLEPELRDRIERGLRGLPRMMPPAFDFRFDDMPAPMTGGRGRLGVQVESLSDQLAGYFGATSGGVLVSSVTKESSAEKAGLKAGDVITSINGAAVANTRDLVEELAGVKDGGEVSVGILRDKKPSTLKATIEEPRRPPTRRSLRPA